MNYDILQKIKDAGGQRKVMRIIYTEKDGTSEGWRYVEPYSFRSSEAGEESLYAWDRGKNGIRRFLLDRIDQAEVVDEIFNPRYPVEIS